MREIIKKFVENRIWNPKGEKMSLRKQLSRMIIFCCVTAVCIQALVMMAVLTGQYVSRERENTLYILESDNVKTDNLFQYVEEIALSIQHNVGLSSFFKGSVYSEEIVTQQLKSVTNLFSERNRLEVSDPFVEKIYLYNLSEKSISSLYYPITISEMKKSQEKSDALYREYLKSGQDFYFQTDGKYLNLCMKLYDTQMNQIGSCIFVLNRAGIEENYLNLEKMEYYSWSISRGEEILLGEETIPEKGSTFFLENEISTGFGLSLHAGVTEWMIYRSLWTTVGGILLISAVLIVLLSVLGRLMAIYYVRPLETVAEKIKLVGEGNFDTKLDEYRAEELKNISDTFNEMTDYIERLVKEVYETQLIAKQSQIQYLQAQMNPHFLFNVLSMIEMRAAMNGDREVQEMLYKLSRLYQGRIFRKNEQFIFLEEEMQIVDFYLSLQNSRFGEKIEYAISYEGEEAAYRHFKVPRLSIEPIVENAVCHGLEPKEDKGKISVSVCRKKEVLNICIEDDGVGFDSDKLTEKSEDKNHSHVGLWNTNKMIQNLCGVEYGLKVTSEIGKGTLVSILLPVKGGDNNVEGHDCG